VLAVLVDYFDEAIGFYGLPEIGSDALERHIKVVIPRNDDHRNVAQNRILGKTFEEFSTV
jgi:hypothetical protein